MKQDQKGFTFVEVMLVLIFVTLIGFAGWYVWSMNKEEPPKDAGRPVTKSGSANVAKENILTLASGSATMALPDRWTYEKDNESCPMNVTSDVECLEGATVSPSEKLRTRYGDGTEFFNVSVGVYENKNQSSPQKWVEEDFQDGSASPGDKASHEAINGHDAYMWERDSGGIREVRYVVATDDKIVLVYARTYEVEVIDGMTVGDFRKFEPQIKALARSIKIN